MSSGTHFELRSIYIYTDFRVHTSTYNKKLLFLSELNFNLNKYFNVQCKLMSETIAIENLFGLKIRQNMLFYINYKQSSTYLRA